MQLIPYVDPYPVPVLDSSVFKQEWKLKKGDFFTDLCNEAFFVKSQTP